MKKKKYEIERDLRYLTLLAQSFPTVAEASTEIINLQAILNLPAWRVRGLSTCAEKRIRKHQT